MPRLVESVRFLKRAGIDIGLNVLVSAATYAELPGIWAWCARQGISRLLLLKFKMTTINHDCQDMMLSADQEQGLLPLIRKLSRRHAVMPMLDCSFFPALAHSRPDRSDLEFFDVNGCLGGNAFLAVTIDGQYKPCSFCQTTCGDTRALNRTVWEKNEALSEFRHRHLHAECDTCAYGDLCNGGCRISNTEWCRNRNASAQQGGG
jgi:radical SAM protein with 4Fe4S-binding SPASM domain